MRLLLKSILVITLVFVFVITPNTGITDAKELQEWNKNVIPRVDYEKYIKETYDELMRDLRVESKKKLVEQALKNRLKDSPRRLLDISSIAVQLYELTNEEAYLDDAQLIFRIVAEGYDTSRDDSDFFINYPMLETYRVLKDNGRIRSEDMNLIHNYIDVDKSNRLHVGDNNQTLARIVGTSLSLYHFPDHKDAQQWKENIEKLWEWLQRKDDIDEDAGHYALIHMVFFVKFIHITEELKEQGLLDTTHPALADNKYEYLQTKDIKNMFYRYRDQISPSGIMPSYGDDYFGTYLGWAYVMEYAAKVYDDPSFLDTAARIFYNYKNNENTLKYTDDFGKAIVDLGEQLSGFTEAMGMDEVSTLTPILHKSGSKITRRNNLSAKNVPDKMLLGNPENPKNPFVMIDLYGEGYHGHPNGRGAIAYYENQGVPIHFGTQRYANGATKKNNVAMVNENIDYPYYDSSEKYISFQPGAGEWITSSIPTSTLFMIDEQEQKTKIQSYNIRLEAGHGEGDFIIDNLRLEGPKGTLIVDDFEDISKWKGKGDYSITSDSTEGDNALSIRIKKDGNIFHFPGTWSYENDIEEMYDYGIEFDIADYTQLKFDWKIKTDEVMSAYLLFRPVWNDDGQVVDRSYGMFDINNGMNVKEVKVEDKGNDFYGEIELDNYFTTETELKRRMLLTQEGTLVIKDELSPGSDVRSMVGGPLWHIYSETEQHGNWFTWGGMKTINQLGNEWFLPSGEKSIDQDLLVYFEEADGRKYGVNDKLGATRFEGTSRTLYVKEKIHPNKNMDFITILLPHDYRISTKELAEEIEIKKVNDSNITNIILPIKEFDLAMQGELVIELSVADWKISRTGDANGDGVFTVEDLEIYERVMNKNKIDDVLLKKMDVNKDGEIGIDDMAYAAYHIEE